jgi:hypothetical protein
MAIGSTNSLAIRPGAQTIVVAGSSHGSYGQANDDARTAQTTANLCKPSGITAATFHWMRVPQGVTRVMAQARVPIATTAVGTSPIIAIVGAVGETDGDPTATDGTIRYKRIDGTQTAAIDIVATGQTLTFPASPTTSNCLNDATWFYSQESQAFDILGCKWVGVLVMTLGACTASAAMPVDLYGLN